MSELRGDSSSHKCLEKTAEKWRAHVEKYESILTAFYFEIDWTVGDFMELSLSKSCLYITPVNRKLLSTASITLTFLLPDTFVSYFMFQHKQCFAEPSLFKASKQNLLQLLKNSAKYFIAFHIH